MKFLQKYFWRLGARMGVRKRLRWKLRARFLLLLVPLLLALMAVNHFVPARHLPWRSLDANAPLGLATKMQLFRLSLSPSSHCQAAISDLDFISATPADPLDGKEACGWKKAQLVSGSKATFTAATMQCPLGVGVNIWSQEINALAQEIFGQSITKIHHAGTYSCRRQRGNGSGAWSEHAFANAWDVTGFTLSDGSVVSVLKHWDKGDKAQRKFLRGARSKACKIFRVTLSPDFNEAHADHFHFDMGPTTSCR